MTLSRQSLSKLAKEAKALSEWTTVRDFANQVYGEGKAAKVEIETYGEYNDEGGTNYHIESINAYDKDGNELDVDYSLPFFQSEKWKRSIDEEEDEDFLDIYREIYWSSDEEHDKWVFFDDLPVSDEGETFDLTVEPKLSLAN
jgi:hypothetical protein